MASLFQPSLIPSSRTPDQMSSFAFCQLLKSSWPASLPTRPSGLPGFLHALPGLFNLGLSYQIVLILSPWGFHILSVPKAAILVQAFNACHRDYCCSFLTAAPNNPSHHCATSLQENSPKLGASCSPSVWETSAVQGHPQLLSEFKPISKNKTHTFYAWVLGPSALSQPRPALWLPSQLCSVTSPRKP